MVTYYCGGGASVSKGKSFSLLNFDGFRLGMDWGGGYDSMRSGPRYSGPLDCLFISHAHHDHCGQVPNLRKRYPQLRIFATSATADLCRMVWNQAIYLAREKGLPPPFTEEEINETAKSIEIIDCGQQIKLTDELIVFPADAGHIIGSISLYILYKKELYTLTGDICFRDRAFTTGAPKLGMEMGSRSRVLIRESTYINKSFEPREVVIPKFLKAVREILSAKGRVLVPALSIDRAQDLYLIAKKAGLPVYIEGARKATEIYASYASPEDNHLLMNANRFENDGARRRFLTSGKPAVIVSSSGMLHSETLSAFWAGEFLPRPGDAIFLVNYQDPDEQGGTLLQAQKGDFIFFNRRVKRCSCRVETFQFSAHMDGPDGDELEQRLNPELVIYNHGLAGAMDRHIETHSNGKRRIRAKVGQEIEV